MLVISRLSGPSVLPLPALSLCMALLGAAEARAQSASCDGAGSVPCGYQVEDVKIQPAPTVFKFQARVSQAKLPTGDGVFHRVIVVLKRGNETLCSEEFREVRVSYGTVNLEIGRNVDCELDQIVAANRNLAFQVCIGGTDNCLRPIALGTTPYSLKSSFAVLSQKAHASDLAGQAGYAHRATADREMFARKNLGVGYFDFSTPDSAPGLYSNPADFAPFAKGGFLTWRPSRENAPTLHVAARDPVRDTPTPLSRLVLESSRTETLGRLLVKSGGILVTGGSSIDGATAVSGMLNVNARTDGSPFGVAVQGPGTFSGTLDVGRGTTVAGGGVHVAGDSDFADALSLTGSLVSGGPLTGGAGGASITGDLTLGSNMIASGTVSAQTASVDVLTVGGTGATVNGPLTVTGQLVMPGSVAMSGVSGNFSVPGTLTAGALQVSGATTLPGLTASGNIGAAGKNPTSGYPSGWTGGIHTRDLYAEGSIGAGPTGAAYIDNAGTIHAQSAAVTGNLQVQTINGKLPGAGDGANPIRFYWSYNCQNKSQQTINPPYHYTFRTECSCNAGDTPISNEIQGGNLFMYISPGWSECISTNPFPPGIFVGSAYYPAPCSNARVGCMTGLLP